MPTGQTGFLGQQARGTVTGSTAARRLTRPCHHHVKEKTMYIDDPDNDPESGGVSKPCPKCGGPKYV